MNKEERLRLYMQANDIPPQRTVIVGDMPVETEIARNLGLINVSIMGDSFPKRACAPQGLIT
ncbi:hypothetical protein ACQPTN_05020 [Bradyrhizobium sp. 13971]